ncbi:protein of unknown function [Candidatus Nitrosotalea okcheonensis]|uniref:Uncharacterized protein n=1 Tax=Candidatus Nitrosotalea okcheonensis TaxID=1903276 RepID=A0A2H1FFM8_9ARCH|nr:protein of unknown function [Candidatus Nitrosotalea okcheonensis]
MYAERLSLTCTWDNNALEQGMLLDDLIFGSDTVLITSKTFELNLSKTVMTYNIVLFLDWRGPWKLLGRSPRCVGKNNSCI